MLSNFSNRVAITRRILTITAACTAMLFAMSSTTESQAQMLYQGAWVAESFGNDKVGIGTEASLYFEALAIPQGILCHPIAPLCNFASTPVTTTGSPTAPGGIGTLFNPLGPGCRPLTVGEMPRPLKGDTLTPLGATCPGRVNGGTGAPCNKRPPLYRNPAFFTAGGAADNQSCLAESTFSGAKATVYLPPNKIGCADAGTCSAAGDRGIAMNGAPVSGTGIATTTGTSFKFPAANASPVPYPEPGMRRTTVGSFVGEGPYLYSYTYAELRNDAGSFGPGKGFFSTAAPTATVQFKNKAGGTTVATATVKRGANRFGGVMKLLGSYTTKVCYFYAGGCGLGYGTWAYELIGASGYKDSKVGSPVVTASYTTNFTFTYYNTAIASVAKYNIVAQRFPWTTGTVTLAATGRGEHKTFEQRKGFDNRTSMGVGTVQLVSPILTQWLAQAANAPQLETGGIAVMQIRIVPEPGVLVGLACGLALLVGLRRFQT
jgi:hypothetical protein